MPSLIDSNFNKSVIYIYEHGDKGAMGIVVNKPMQLDLGNVLEHLDIHSKDNNIIKLPVLMGGPVSQEHGFILYQPKKQSIEISASKDMLQAIADGNGPNKFIVTLGYSGWSGGQLEQEIMRNDWLVVPANSKILFSTPIGKRWQGAAKLIGVDIEQISTQTGHG